MHVVDLGVLQYLIGSVFKTLVDKNFAKSAKRLKAGRQIENMNLLRRLDDCTDPTPDFQGLNLCP